jgi:hypothetical protein
VGRNHGSNSKTDSETTDARPVIGPHWNGQDYAFLDIVEGIRKVVQEIKTNSLSQKPTFDSEPANKLKFSNYKKYHSSGDPRFVYSKPSDLRL